MTYDRQPPKVDLTIDMTPDGQFRTQNRRPGVPLATRVAAWALLVAVIAGAIGVAVLALWAALALIPIALVAGLVAWIAFRIQVWRVRRSGGLHRAVYRSGG